MPEMIRTWVIPTSGSSTDLTIELCEPPLTGDSLGLKTWGTSFVMAKKLEELGNLYFGNILSRNGLTQQAIVPSQSGPTVESESTMKIELTMGGDETMQNRAIVDGNTSGGHKTVVRVSESVVNSDMMHQKDLSAKDICNEWKILELGSGTGLLGLTATLLWNRTTVLTDLPDIVPNLIVNLRRNGFDQTSEANATAAILDWSDAEHSVVFSPNPNDKFEV